MEETPSSELATVRPVFRAAARTVVPEARELGEEGWAEVESIVEHALSDRPAAVRRRIRLLLRALEWAPLLRWGRRFTSLRPGRRKRLLAALQNAPILLLRQGFWGLRTLVFMGYYGREAVHPEVGYDARLRGRRQKDGPTAGRARGELLDVTPGGTP